MESWLERGTTCPVCRRPISDDASQEGGPGAAAGGGGFQQPSYQPFMHGHHHHHGHFRHQMADDWLASDLAFRLGALHMRYPRYISPHMVHTWRHEARSTGACVGGGCGGGGGWGIGVGGRGPRSGGE